MLNLTYAAQDRAYTEDLRRIDNRITTIEKQFTWALVAVCALAFCVAVMLVRLP